VGRRLDEYFEFARAVVAVLAINHDEVEAGIGQGVDDGWSGEFDEKRTEHRMVLRDLLTKFVGCGMHGQGLPSMDARG